MTIKDMKQRVYRLIEELSTTDTIKLTDDPDLAAKINTSINIVQNELARIKKIPKITTKTVTEGETMLITDIASDVYQLNRISGVTFDLVQNEITFLEGGTAKFYYYAYPTQIDSETADTTVLDLSTDALEIMPFGVAGDILKADVSTNYGAVYSNRYNELKQGLDARNNAGSIEFEEVEL